jgi:GNAT superfamily N-acetyltransferase
MPIAGDYVSVRSSRYTLAPGAPEDLGEVRSLYRESATWLGSDKQTDQWSRPWPDVVRHLERMRKDLREGKTWLVWDHGTAAGTITLDTEEPLTASGRPVWPTARRHEMAVYVRRVIVRRRYAGHAVGAGLLDWAAEVAMRSHGASLIRVDVWTTNSGLHEYYKRQRFTRCDGRDPAELINYPAQALFEREIERAGQTHTRLFVEAVGARMLSAIGAFTPGRIQLAGPDLAFA